MILYLHYDRGPKNFEALVPHPLSCRGIVDRETSHFPTWRVPHFGKFGRSESNSMDVGRGPRAKIMRKLGPCRFEMETYYAGWCKSFTKCAKILLKTSIGRTDGRMCYINITPTACCMLTRDKNQRSGMLLSNIQ